MKLFRRLLAVLIVAAYVGATMTEAAALAPPVMDAMGGGMTQQSDSREPMPCKGKALPSCVSDFGCIFLISLPAPPDLSLYTATDWLSVTYGAAAALLHGRSIKPALGPPIPA